jgi:hypothetical protein
VRVLHFIGQLFFLGIFALSAHSTEEMTPGQYELLRREVEEIRLKLSKTEKPGEELARFAEKNALPSGSVKTDFGKLKIGGLLQVWNHMIPDDEQDVFSSDGAFEGSGGTSECINNDTYRVRRAQLKFSLDITERISACVMYDAAREATSFPEAPGNQGVLKRRRENWRYPIDGVPSGSVERVLHGSGAPNRMLREAYLKFDDFVPHHEFKVGQFYVPLGEEGSRDSRFLDFSERAMVTQFAHFADNGILAHGWWWGEVKEEARFHYWLGGFNGAGTLEQDRSNRADDNDAKDFLGGVMLRPLWGHDLFGDLELGYSRLQGIHGETGDTSANGTNPRSGLNRRRTVANRQFAWALYQFGSEVPVRGWWMRAEWGSIRDRFAPFEVGVLDLGSGDPLGIGDSVQASPRTLITQGWYFSTGYKLADSFFSDRLRDGGWICNLLEPLEFTFRYERFGNIFCEDLSQPDTHTDIFSSSVWTFGVNYYFKNHNAKIQANYAVVNEPDNGHQNRGFREVNNNTIMLLNYQIAW